MAYFSNADSKSTPHIYGGYRNFVNQTSSCPRCEVERGLAEHVGAPNPAPAAADGADGDSSSDGGSFLMIGLAVVVAVIIAGAVIVAIVVPSVVLPRS